MKIIKIFLMMVAPINSFADQLIYVTKDQALLAKEIIVSKKQLILTCTCCTDTLKTYVKVLTADVIERDAMYSVKVEGITRYSERFSGFLDLAYCFIQKKSSGISIATDSAFSSNSLSEGCFKNIIWQFPDNSDKYWDNISNGSVNVISQKIPIFLDTSGFINFQTPPTAAYLGTHADTADVIVDPISLNVVLAYHEKEATFCNYTVELPYQRLSYYSSSSDNPLPVSINVNGEFFKMESASITFSNKEGDVRELSTLSPYFFTRFNRLLEGLPLQEDWMRTSLFPEHYPQGMIKVDEAKFRSSSNINQVAVLKDFCLVPLKSVE